MVDVRVAPGWALPFARTACVPDANTTIADYVQTSMFKRRPAGAVSGAGTRPR